MNRTTEPPRVPAPVLIETTLGDWLTVIATFTGLWFLTKDYLRGVWK